MGKVTCDEIVGVRDRIFCGRSNRRRAARAGLSGDAAGLDRRLLRKGNTTLLVGVEDSAVERAIAIAHRTAPGALVITLDLERYERI